MKGTAYLNEHTRVVVFGATGREASQVITESEALFPGLISAGVTPGKGGTETGLPIPVYDTLLAARSEHPEINTALIYVPPASVRDAVMECLTAGIRLIYIVTEHVPVRDACLIYAAAKREGARVIGGTSLGCFVPEIGRIGAMGGSNPFTAFRAGSLAILSKSGGLTPTTAEMFRRRGWGVRMALALGGDIISCTTYADVLPELEKDPLCKAVVLLGEPGGSYEQQAAELIQSGGFTKPVAAFIAGVFQESLPEGVSFGHAGAVVERGSGKATEKKAALRACGPRVRVVDYYHQLVEAIEELGVPRDFEDELPGTVQPLYSTLTR